MGFAGRLRKLYVTYYDDRKYNIDSDQADGFYPVGPCESCSQRPRYDVYCAVSTDNGASFTQHELYETIPADFAALEFCCTPLGQSGLKPGEYFDLAVDQSAADTGVWAAYIGTSRANTNGNDAHRSVIYVSRITDP